MKTASLRLRLWSVFAALLFLGVFTFLCVDFWPATLDAHLVLRQLGLAYGGAAWHPVWSAYAASFGLDASLLSVVSGGACVGVFAWLAFRWLGWRAGLLATLAFATSAPVVMASTRVSAAPFDCLLALVAVACFGKRLGWLASLAFGVLLFADLLRLGLANPRGLLLDGVPAACAVAALAGLLVKKFRSQALFCLVGLLCLSVWVTGRTLKRNRSDLADGIAQLVLARVDANCRWLVVDTSLEEALARRLALRSDGPYLVRTGCDTNREYGEELVRQASEAFPDDMGLRKAAELGVRSFLEELSLVETNEARIAYVWSRSLWTSNMIAKVEAELGGDAHSELVRRRIAALRGQADGADKARRAVALRLEELGAGWGQLEGRLGAALKKGDYAALRNEMRYVLRTDRTNLLGNALMGALEARAGDYRGAELFLRRAVASGRAPPLVVNDLAETLRRLKKLDEAESFARKALAEQPDSWQIKKTLAAILRDRQP